jgi:hypothetical protein
MDFRADFRSETDDRHSQVWNQCVYKFRSEVAQADPDGPNTDEEALARRVLVKTVITANADQENSAGNPEQPAGSGWERELEYVLHYDPKGKTEADHPRNNVKSCTWKQAAGKKYFLPRYMFRVKGLGGTGGVGNPEVQMKDLEACGVALRPIFRA